MPVRMCQARAGPGLCGGIARSHGAIAARSCDRGEADVKWTGDLSAAESRTRRADLRNVQVSNHVCRERTVCPLSTKWQGPTHYADRKSSAAHLHRRVTTIAERAERRDVSSGA